MRYISDGPETARHLRSLRQCTRALDPGTHLVGGRRALEVAAATAAGVTANDELDGLARIVVGRCRGRQVQVLLSDSLSSNDWPLARDVVDYLPLRRGGEWRR